MCVRMGTRWCAYICQGRAHTCSLICLASWSVCVGWGWEHMREGTCASLGNETSTAPLGALLKSVVGSCKTHAPITCVKTALPCTCPHLVMSRQMLQF